MSVLNLDTAAKLEIIIPEDHSYIFAIKIKDKVTQVYQQFTGVWKFVIARDEKGTTILKTFLLNDGFTLSVDLLTMTFDVPTILNLLTPNENYFHDFRGDVGGYSKHPFHGRFRVNPVAAKP